MSQLDLKKARKAFTAVADDFRAQAEKILGKEVAAIPMENLVGEFYLFSVEETEIQAQRLLDIRPKKVGRMTTVLIASLLYEIEENTVYANIHRCKKDLLGPMKTAIEALRTHGIKTSESVIDCSDS